MSTAAGDRLAAVERRATAALASREMVRVARLAPQTIGASTLMALLYMLIFGGALAGRLGRVDGVTYAGFILPGLAVMTAVTQAFGNSSSSMLQAKGEGYLDALLTSPLRPWQIAASYVAGGAVRGGLAALVVSVVGSAFAGAPARPLLAAAAVALAALLAAAAGLVAGIWAETFDQQSMLTMLLIQPLAMVGGVFYAATELPPRWRSIVHLDPIFYLVDAARAGFAGVGEAPVLLSLAVAALAAAGAYALASALLARGWRTRL